MTVECGCVALCDLSDQFQPATRELMVFTKSRTRYFDLDAVRQPYKPTWISGNERLERGGQVNGPKADGSFGRPWTRKLTHDGAPPLDWWLIPYDLPQPGQEPSNMTATFYVGDAIEVMSKLPEKSVDLVLTSPPFLALRSYLPQDHPDKALEGGSQATPGEYVDWLLDVVEACARVLAPHGSLCFELGDTYAGGGGGDMDKLQYLGGRSSAAEMNRKPKLMRDNPGAWPLVKSLSLIPESFRWAMVYGHNPFTGRKTEPWRLRNVIRWVRPNPPVGALGDKFRPATSELMVFCKAKDRYFDLDAVREPHKYDYREESGRSETKRGDKTDGQWSTLGDWNPSTSGGAPPLDWWNIPLLEGEEPTRYGPKEETPKPRSGMGKVDSRDAERAKVGLSSGLPGRDNNPIGAPPLDWWNIPPGGFSGAHYAVWPPELLIKPIKAMCPESVCRTCGEARRRIVSNRDAFDFQPSLAAHIKDQRVASGLSRSEVNAWFNIEAGIQHWEATDEANARVPSPAMWPTLKERLGLSDTFDELVLSDRRWTESEVEYRDVSDYPSGWTQDSNGKIYQRLKSRKDRTAPDRFSDCGHNFWRNGLVLDPFAGSGTTLAVATGHGRDAIGVDLDERNYDLALDRVGPLVLEQGVL